MKKLFSCFVISILTIPFLGNKLKADDKYIFNVNDDQDFEIIKIEGNSSGYSANTITTFDRSEYGVGGWNTTWFDSELNKIFAHNSYTDAPYYRNKFSVYDLTNNSWSIEELDLTSDTTPSFAVIDSSNILNTSNISTNTSNISTNTSNISTNTSSISTNKSNIKSLGEGVAGSTALTAALSALPQTSKESKLSCGVGTGAYSSRYAVGFGCASKVNERVDINAGGSYVFGGSKSYGGGTLDSGVVKAGFVFKLGELNKPTQISFKDKKIIDKKISNLVKDNQNLKEKNDEIITQNQKLLARLEKLENIALKFQSSSEMISVAKKD